MGISKLMKTAQNNINSNTCSASKTAYIVTIDFMMKLMSHYSLCKKCHKIAENGFFHIGYVFCHVVIVSPVYTCM